ncbi:acyloxyacyl hydrolase [Terriglobus albidus]|uniref:acyloxyacyl hydrolase n=1 Tax=Terriglobus albidus TaxID=1592106 RepID=UPI0021DFA3F3|nr:acyloxyacyl hydrolase [Terriglobus albidus]
MPLGSPAPCKVVILTFLLFSPPLIGQSVELAAAKGNDLAIGISPPPRPPAKAYRAPGSEVSVTLMIPDGDYQLFSATTRCYAWTVGVEYERPMMHMFRMRVDYAVEAIPVFLLSQPARSDFWGNGISHNQKPVPGISILPIGFRFLLFEKSRIRPFAVGKLGAAIFNQKAFSPAASKYNFNIQAAAGLLFRMKGRYDLRVEPFEFFHISNGYMAASNPGMDQIAVRVGITYHLSSTAQN